MRFNRFFVSGIIFVSLILSSTTRALAEPLHPAEKTYQKALSADRDGRLIETMGLSKQAAEQGHPGAQSFYGYLLDKADFDDDAEVWYRKAAAQNNIDGLLHLARLQTTKGNEKDTQEALTLYQKAADLGSIEAMRILAISYKNGDLNLQRDNDLAVEWFLKAANKNDLESMMTLAKANESGKLGLKVDYQKALELYLQASKLDSTEAIRRLHLIYQNGEMGQRKNPIEAKMWQQKFNQLKAK
jgi:TPR repeat protein